MWWHPTMSKVIQSVSLKSSGDGLFNLLFLKGCKSVKNWIRMFVTLLWCLQPLSWMTSLMSGILKSVRRVWFDTYREASAMPRSKCAKDCLLAPLNYCYIRFTSTFPYASISYVNIGFITTLYINSVFSIASLDFLPYQPDNCLNS